MSEADERLTSRLEAGEVVLARGRFDEAGSEAGADLPTGGHRYLLVTDRRILWTTRGEDVSLELSTVTGSTEVTQLHRYAIELRHEPVERFRWAPSPRVSWWRRGHAEVVARSTETTFVFSHHGTSAAEAVRRRLKELGVPAGEPVTMPRSRPRDVGSATLERD